MNHFSRQFFQTLALAVVALLTAIIWRVEVELNGWGGLTWIEYFHWAIPLNVGLFAAWLGIYSNLPSLKSRLKLVGLFLLAAPILYWLLEFAFTYFFVAGPSAFIMVLQQGFSSFSLLRRSIFVIYPAILLFFWLVAKRFGCRLNWRIYLFSSLFFLCAFPLARLCLRLFEPSITPDAIHAIKSGYLFPFMAIGLGLPFLASCRRS
jgi:hypothetical protein